MGLLSMNSEQLRYKMKNLDSLLPNRSVANDEQLYDLYNKFQQVINDTFNDEDSTGNYFAPKASSVIDLVQLDKQLERVSQYQLVGVSIRSLEAITYNVTEAGNQVEFNVTLAYHYYRKTA